MSETVSAQAQLWKRARKVIPRGASSGHRVGWDQVFVRAHGAYVWDADGNRYIDHLLAWGPIVLGHTDTRVNSAVTDALAVIDLTGVGPQRNEIETAEIVCGYMPCADKVAFCTSGTDATLHSVHIARAVTGRRKVLKFHGSYHGWHDQLAVGGSRADSTPTGSAQLANSAGLHPGSVSDVVVVEWNDVQGVQAAFDTQGHDIAAVFAEPYVHSFGCVPPSPGFLEFLREITVRNGAVLVFDEVKTGFRTAVGGYQSVSGVTPDLTAFGKAIANGFAVAGVAGTDAVMGHMGAYSRSHATIDGTYNASPYAMAAARATLGILIEESIPDRLAGLGKRMRDGLGKAIADSGAPACVAGHSSEWCVYFRPTAPTNFREALDVDTDLYARYHTGLLSRGILEPMNATGDRRLCAALTEDDVDETIAAATAALADL